jgi:RNA polymerase sigma-70 factor (ECF subfamily)
VRRHRSHDILIDRARSGDADAWRSLHDLVAGRLIVWLRAQPQLDPSLDHDDIASETWCTAAARIADFDGTVDDFAGWLFGIARHHTMNVNRRTWRRRTTPTDQDPRSLGNATLDERGQADRELVEQLEWIRALVSHLSPREADVIVCIEVVGLDVAAASMALSLSANAVRVAHHRALKRLRSILAGDSCAGPDEGRPTRTGLPGVQVPPRTLRKNPV